MRRYVYHGIAILLIAPIPVLSFNRSFFYRSSAFWDEPRLDHPYLTSIEVQLLGGAGHRSSNNTGKQTSLLSLYGHEVIRNLNAVDAENPLLLHDNPRTISFQGIASVFEADINAYQNLAHGTFLQLHIPIVAIQLQPSGFLLDSHTKPCKHFMPAWHQTTKDLTDFLERIGLRICRMSKPGLSDTTLFLGWTHSFENTDYLDFIDTTFKSGVLFPTGKQQNINSLFDIPYGYNGHFGIPFSFDVSAGLYDWLTFGAHADALIFFKKAACLRLKSKAESCSGIIAAQTGIATVDHGAVWRIGAYIKADHFVHGLSLLAAFSYEQQNQTHVLPQELHLFASNLAHKDQRFAKWSRSQFHLLAEYDFAHEESRAAPRLSLFYNKQMTGLRVFNISTFGGYLGIDISWRY